jgi:hypothetical protein
MHREDGEKTGYQKNTGRHPDRIPYPATGGLPGDPKANYNTLNMKIVNIAITPINAWASM